MKRIVCIAVTVFVMVSTIVSTVGAVSYSIFDSTYAIPGDCTDYVNEGEYDRMQYRANCYGFAMRLHYGDDDIGYEDYYAQLAGEFWDKTNAYLTNSEVYSFYLRDRNNDGKAFDLHTVYQFIGFDCDTLGYELTFVASYGPNDSFVPPSASSQDGKRLIALVGREDGEDVHFFMQNSDNTWSHKSDIEPATSKCVECNVNITNSNISAHIHCVTSADPDKDYVFYDGDVYLFQIDAPGSSDRFHEYGDWDSYCTQVSSKDVPGDYVKSAIHIDDITAETIRGRINYIDDVDFYVFDVLENGNYTINFSKHTYAYRVYFGEVSDELMLVSTTAHGLAVSTASTSFTKSLQIGKRYYIKVIAYGQTTYDSAITYSLNVS